MALEEEGVEGGDVFHECGPAPGEPDGLDQVDNDVRGEEDGVVEGVLYPGEDVAHLSVAVEGGGGWKGFLNNFDDVLDDFEVDLGSLAGVAEGWSCHGGMIRDEGEEWNSHRGTKRTLLGFRLEVEDCGLGIGNRGLESGDWKRKEEG